MQIISGKYQRRSLKYPKNRLFRPTKSMVREAVFSIIGERILNAAFLDLCSGSGAVGLEAESRGAATVFCIDIDTGYLKQNKDLLQADINIIRSDACRFLKKTFQKFDIIYFDPIWADYSTYKNGLQFIFDRQLLNDNSLLIVEHDKTLAIASLVPIPITKQSNYGNSIISIF
jgi:16S rRNA (guanine966-N2)-methyltransferase